MKKFTLTLFIFFFSLFMVGCQNNRTIIEDQNKEIERLKASINEESIISSSTSSSTIPIAKEGDKHEESNNQFTPKIVEQKQTQDGSYQLKIERCKSNQAITKSQLMQDYENTFNLLTAAGNETIQRVYQNCLNESYASSTFNFGFVGLSSGISAIGEWCSIKAGTTRDQIANFLKTSKAVELAKIEQQIQKEYQDCLNR